MHLARSPRRSILLGAATGLVALAASATPALAGQIVYSYEPADGDAQIRVMNDDGSNDRMIVHEDDIPGAEAVYSPYVSPDGATVVFQARTPSSGGYGLYCGFRCSGIYAYRDGHITRISQNPTNCPPGDLCFGLDTSPRITGGGNHLFYEMIYGEPSGSGVPSSISTTYYRTMTPGGGNEVELPHTSCSEGSHVTPNPKVDGQFAASAYCVGPGMHALQIKNVSGPGEQTLAYDDYEFANPAFRGDGQLLVGAESGGDPGLWLYPRDGSDPKRLVNLTWDDDNSPFGTSPTFVGASKVAFIYDETIRTVSTSCTSCGLGSTAALGQRKGVDGVAWTSQNIPNPVVPPPPPNPGGGGGGGVVTPPTGTPRGTNRGGTGTGAGAALATLKAPSKSKLATALRKGIKVPFVAQRAGKLTMQATISGKDAKKLRLVRKATKKRVVVAKGSATVKKAGDAAVTLKFTTAAKKRLKRARSVSLALSGTFAGTKVSGRTRLAR